MWQRLLMRLFVVIAAVLSVGGYLWMTLAPPEGLRVSRDGVPYFTPPVLHPVTGEAVPMANLIHHYKGGK